MSSAAKPSPKDTNASSVRPEIVVDILFGYAIPRSLIESLRKNNGPNLFEIDRLDGYPVLHDHRISRNNNADKRVFVAIPPVLNPWRLREKAAHDGGFFPPRMWPTEEARAALEAMLRKNMLWNSDTETMYGLHVAIREGRSTSGA